MSDNCLPHNGFLGFAGANSSIKSRLSNRFNCNNRNIYCIAVPEFRVKLQKRQHQIGTQGDPELGHHAEVAKKRVEGISCRKKTGPSGITYWGQLRLGRDWLRRCLSPSDSPQTVFRQ